MEETLEQERKNPGTGQLIYLVDDIEKRGKYTECTFGGLKRDVRYSLYIEYNNTRPHRANNLNYEELKNEIAGNLVTPPDSSKIFVGPPEEIPKEKAN